MTFEEENTSTIMTEDGRLVVTRAYCHNGHELISNEVKISGYPAIKLLISDGKEKEYVYISSVDADRSKKGGAGFKDNQLLTVACPVCEEELDNIAPCDCTKGSKFMAIYLNKKRSFTSCVGICNSWGCYRSFMNTAWRIISRLADKSVR